MNEDLDPRLEPVGRAVGEALAAYAPLAPHGLSLAQAAQDRARRHRRRRHAAVVGAAAATLLVITGAAVAVPHLGGNGTVAPPAVAGAGLTSCGVVPPSDGPHPATVRATVRAPRQAASGARVDVQVRLRSRNGAPQEFVFGVPQVLVVRGREVVGAFVGASTLHGYRAEVPAVGEAPFRTVSDTVSGRVLLSGCVSGEVDYRRPDASRIPLPPGSYELVAVLQDPDATSGAPGVLVSDPAPIEVTATEQAPPPAPSPAWSASPGEAPLPEPAEVPNARDHPDDAPTPEETIQAQALLALFSRSASDGVTTAVKGDGVYVTSDRTGLVGSWEPGVGENNKIALLAGDVRAPIDMESTTSTGSREVRWPTDAQSRSPSSTRVRPSRSSVPWTGHRTAMAAPRWSSRTRASSGPGSTPPSARPPCRCGASACAAAPSG